MRIRGGEVQTAAISPPSLPGLPPLIAPRSKRASADDALPLSPGERKAGWRDGALLSLLVAFFLLLSFALNVADPIWEGIDEPAHFQHVKFLVEQHRLPRTDADLPLLPVNSAVNCRSIKCVGHGSTVGEPPLYYAIAALFVLPIDLDRNVSYVANPYFTWAGYPLRNGAALHTLAEEWPYHGMVLGVHVMRAVSGLMVAGAIVAIYYTALAAVRSPHFALLAAATAALTPGVLLSSASVNNDNAAILTGSLALLAAVKALTTKARRWPWLATFAMMVVLAFESKINTYFLLPVAIVLALLLVRNHDRRTVLASIGGLVAAGIVGALTLTRVRVNIIAEIGSIHDALRANWDCSCTMFLQHYWGAIPNLWETYWGSYGWETFHPPAPFYRPFLAITLLGVAGLLWACWRKVRAGALRAWLRSDTGASLVLLSAAFAILLVMVDYRYLVTKSDGGTTHARFLFPAFAASSIFLALGINALRPKWLRSASFGLLFASCLSLVGYSIETLPKSFGPTLPVYGDIATAGAQHAASVNFANGMQLLGWSLDGGQPPRPGQTVHLRLFWGAGKTPDFDYSAFVRLDDGEGLLVHDADHGPGQAIGLLAHTWQPGEVIPDDWTVAIPATAHAGVYKIEVGVYDYRDLRPIPTDEGPATVTLGQLTIAGA